MPVKQPFYGLPEFQPTGDPQVDKSLAKWRQDFGASYIRNLYEAERIPFVISTQGLESGDGSTALSTGVAGTTVGSTLIVKQVGFQGGEQVIVIGNVYLALASPGTTSFQIGTVELHTRFPDGTTGLGQVRLQAEISNLTSVAGIAGSFGQTWRVPTRIQSGGLHRFSLRGFKSNSSSLVVASNPSLTIMAF